MDYEMMYRSVNDETVFWTYEGTDAVLTGDELIDTFREHWQAEGMPEAAEFLTVSRDSQKIWSNTMEIKKLHEIHATIERWPNERFHAVLTVDGNKDELFTYALEQAHNWVVNRTAKKLLDSAMKEAAWTMK